MGVSFLNCTVGSTSSIAPSKVGSLISLGALRTKAAVLREARETVLINFILNEVVSNFLCLYVLFDTAS